MGEWSAWYRVIKETGPGRKYLYLQRVRRVPGAKHPQVQNHSLGRFNIEPVPRKRQWFDPAAYEESGGSGIGLAIFGWRDEFDRPIDSLYNRYITKETAPEARREKHAEAKNDESAAGTMGDGEEVASSGDGNGEETSE